MTKTIISTSQRPPWGQRKVVVVKKGGRHGKVSCTMTPVLLFKISIKEKSDRHRDQKGGFEYTVRQLLINWPLSRGYFGNWDKF